MRVDHNLTIITTTITTTTNRHCALCTVGHTRKHTRDKHTSSAERVMDDLHKTKSKMQSKRTPEGDNRGLTVLFAPELHAHTHEHACLL